MLTLGNQTINGVYVIVELDNDTGEYYIIFPTIKDDIGNPMTIRFSPGTPEQNIANIIDFITRTMGGG